MLLALGAASAALDALTSLVSKKPASQATTGFSQTASTPFDVAASLSTTGSVPASGTATPSQGGCLSPATMSALLAAQDQSSAASSAPLSQTDALKDLFAQIDGNGDGKIDKSEFENALGAGGTNVAQADDVFNKLDKDGDGTVNSDELSSALKGRHHRHAGASPSGQNSASASAASAYSAIEQAKQRETQGLASSLTTSLSLSA